jgi:predicted LPLAT superfamily acyltransferase
MGPHPTKRKEGGGRFAIWLIRTISLKLGRGVARPLLDHAVLLSAGRSSGESRDFLTRISGQPAGASKSCHIHRSRRRSWIVSSCWPAISRGSTYVFTGSTN